MGCTEQGVYVISHVVCCEAVLLMSWFFQVSMYCESRVCLFLFFFLFFSFLFFSFFFFFKDVIND